ncbi:hypothetical protein [Allomuricauda sp. SCSIO 65647]|uniref:hypothetical protein n=1 Tax=Allomuricauda sp. SCSIO 65647 TaxID=2908843 RepID=UPI001F3EAEDC|nr:hypothetical protein [Muricauda sp. SCSIO 65647]UJH66825.1 hypothetical protein L0P89_12760 [Muricauda sp. SCSIO 65647]
MQQEKDYLQREIERMTLFLKTLLRRVAGLNDENFRPEYDQLEKELKEELNFSLNDLYILDQETFEEKLKELHLSHIEKLVELVCEVLKRDRAFRLSQKNKIAANTIVMLDYIDKKSSTYSLTRQHLRTSLSKHLTSNI